MRCMKAVSDLLAVLVALAIVIGVGVAVALLSGALVQRMQPSGASLTLQSVRAQKLSTSGPVLIDIVATVTGTQSVRISSVSMYTGSTSMSCTVQAPSPGSYFSPGSTIQISVQCNTNPSDYSPIRVVVSFCDVANKCFQVSGSGVVEPYSP